MSEPQEYTYTDRWGNEYVLMFTRAKYFDNDNLAVLAHNQGDFGWEPYATITVNIEALPGPYTAAIDTNNLGDSMLDWLVVNGLASHTGLFLQSGYCTYPVVEFDHDWIDSLEGEPVE